MKLLVIVAVSIASQLFLASASDAAWKVQSIRIGSHTRVTSAEPSEAAPRGEAQVLRSFPMYLSEDAPPSREIFEEVLYTDEAFARLRPSLPVSLFQPVHPDADSEVRDIVVQGPTSNRINLTIVGDGYTRSEKDKFFADAKRITDDLFASSTFKTYLPLFNVYAVFVPSKDSGISDEEDKDTALGLYRDPKGSKRAIMPGNSMAAEKAIRMAPACDFPILLANDDFYGGLGGRYAITTRSERSGKIVLRHELGHNFGQVGEEYDSGQVYTGANFSSSRDLPWKHWIDGTPKFNGTKFLAGNYVWHKLSEGPYRSEFDFPAPGPDGAYSIEFIISSVGWNTPDDVVMTIDGQATAIEGEYTTDRSFFTAKLDRTLAPGKHKLEFTEKVKDGDNVLAFAEVYAHEAGYDAGADVYGAYDTFNESGRKVGYRPTHDSCIMRNMLSDHFCSVDLENFWIRFLSRVKLIDELKTGQTVNLKTPPLEGLDIRWYKLDGGETELTDLRGKSEWQPEGSQAHGKYRVKVQFRTPEVRKYTRDFDAQKDFTI